MSKNKILVKITGSIAAYKAAYLISNLVQNGYEVKTVVTESALNFIGKATLEGLTGNHVYWDSFESGKMMSHIYLVKWADLTILVPADANTINKYSSGIADNLITSLFLARDATKPYLVAPAMNVAMYEHPATQASLNLLAEWGIKILPTEDGHLACGDEGKGKLLDPDRIFEFISLALNRIGNGKNIIITSGGTKEKIDNVRYISNMSTGKTGASIAEYFIRQGYNVTFIKSEDSAIPVPCKNILEYEDYSDLKKLISTELQSNFYDAIIHLAAVSDYSPNQINISGIEKKLPIENKLNSNEETITITLKRNPKIINEIKAISKNKEIKLIGFKFVREFRNLDKKKIISKYFENANADLMVYNSLDYRMNGTQTNFEVVSPDNDLVSTATDASELAKLLDQYLKAK